MPTYDYQCKTCGLRFEHFQSITSDALTQCPADVCRMTDERKGKGEVVRLISGGAGLVFKGEGFYLTDYARKDSGSKGAGPSTSAKTGDGASGSARPDSSGGDAKGSEPSGGESKGSGSKRSDSKGSESKGGGESTGSGSKPSSGSDGAS